MQPEHLLQVSGSPLKATRSNHEKLFAWNSSWGRSGGIVCLKSLFKRYVMSRTYVYVPKKSKLNVHLLFYLTSWVTYCACIVV